MHRDDVIMFGRPLLDKHGLVDWRIDQQNLNNPYLTGLNEGVLGLCDFPNKTVWVDNTIPRRKLKITILHEIAHAFTGSTRTRCGMVPDR